MLLKSQLGNINVARYNVVKICEHKFEKEDLQHEGYSLTEVDLFPAAGQPEQALSIRHNKDSDVYEIFDFRHMDPYTDLAVTYSGGIDDVIRKANRLEEAAVGHSSFEYGHNPVLNSCPDDIYDTAVFED